VKVASLSAPIQLTSVVALLREMHRVRNRDLFLVRLRAALPLLVAHRSLAHNVRHLARALAETCQQQQRWAHYSLPYSLHH
jgi:hypothetical protein